MKVPGNEMKYTIILLSALFAALVCGFSQAADPEYAILSNDCWSVGVWNVPRVGVGDRDSLGNVYWFNDNVSFMSDAGLIVTEADDTTSTVFSICDGSNDSVGFTALTGLTVESLSNYDYAHAEFGAFEDTSVVGSVEYFLPDHPDTCLLIIHFNLCNNCDTSIAIHIGFAADWDIPEETGRNRSQIDLSRQAIFIHGDNESLNWYGGFQLLHDIPGGKALENDEWVVPNGGFVPARIGGLLGRLSTLEATDSVENLTALSGVLRDAILAPDSCVQFCMILSASFDGVNQLRQALDKGESWLLGNGISPWISCDPFYRPPTGCLIGDANIDGIIDIDDVVCLVSQIFPMESPLCPAYDEYDWCCLDCNGSGGFDIDDVVYLITYIFAGGYPPIGNPGC
jgi:hypothetical protein